MSVAPDSPLATRWCPSPNFEPRRGGREPNMLLLHYTGMQSCDEALERLTSKEAEVSSHYLVDDDGSIIQLVPESQRAYHAGQSLNKRCFSACFGGRPQA